jgi:hypothetical protein
VGAEACRRIQAPGYSNGDCGWMRSAAFCLTGKFGLDGTQQSSTRKEENDAEYRCDRFQPEFPGST